MKKGNVLLMLLMGLTVLSTSISCKKDRSSEPQPPERVLTEVYSNDLLEHTYKYNDAKQLVEIGYYNSSTGKPSQFIKLEYDEHGLTRKTRVNPEGEATRETVYERDSDGGFVGEETTALTGADAGKIVERYAYTYDEQGYVSKVMMTDPDTGDEVGYVEIDYFPDGTVEQMVRYVVDAAGRAHPGAKDQYVGHNGQLPESIARYQGNPLIHLYAPFFVVKEISSIIYDKTSVLVESEHVGHFSDREYDEQGYMTRQTLIVESVKPAAADEERVLTYVYAELP